MPRELKVEMSGQGLRVAVVVARFNQFVTGRLLEGAIETLTRHGVRDDDITLAWVPGSFELPVVAKSFGTSGQYDAVICLGAVIRGETDHYEMVANQAAAGISAAGRETGIPTVFGVLTTDNMEQAINRAGGKSGNLGSNAASAAIETARLVQAIKTA
ncbi:MAG TPA: 6,7-dimethyl-8-ribityllumazine synthase [Dehalococcoidia bacterium]|nr:6,7-dimethyl-8-ribityllumazine synthase [Dehalococcoidia bacterium]